MFKIDWEEVLSKISDLFSTKIKLSQGLKLHSSLYLYYLEKGYDEAKAFEMAKVSTKYFFSKIDES